MDKKIFIIEDDVNILLGLQAKFRVEGFFVAIDSGSEKSEVLLNKIKEFNPDYIILDSILPTNDGFEMVRAIKANELTRKVLVFLYTSLSDKDIRGLKIGVDYYILKHEINLDELVQKVKKTIINREKMSRIN